MASYCLLLYGQRNSGQVSNWLVTSPGVSNLVINLTKAQKIKGNYS